MALRQAIEVTSGHRGDRLLADIAKQKYEHVKTVYRPIEDAYIDRVLGFGSEGTISRLTGQGAVTAEQAIGPTAGVRPYRLGSGKMLGERVMAALTRGAARSGAATTTALTAENRAKQAKAGIIRFGQGQSEQSTASLGRGAALAASTVIANQAAAEQAAMARSAALGQIAGTGGGLYFLQNRGLDPRWGGAATTGQVIPGSTTPNLNLNMPTNWPR